MLEGAPILAIKRLCEKGLNFISEGHRGLHNGILPGDHMLNLDSSPKLS